MEKDSKRLIAATGSFVLLALQNLRLYHIIGFNLIHM
jgi:hypothetical protein